MVAGVSSGGNADSEGDGRKRSKTGEVWAAFGS